MKNIKQSNQQMNPVATGIAGAVVGAGVAVAASRAMKDAKTRKKVKDVFNAVKDQAIDYVESVKTQTARQQGIVEKKLLAGKKSVAKTQDMVKAVVHKARVKNHLDKKHK